MCVGGRSSGCRLAITYALRHPEAAGGLLLWRITGGSYAAMRLVEKYYGEYVLMPDEVDADMGANEEWAAKEDELAALSVDVMNGVRSRSTA